MTQRGNHHVDPSRVTPSSEEDPFDTVEFEIPTGDPDHQVASPTEVTQIKQSPALSQLVSSLRAPAPARHFTHPSGLASPSESTFVGDALSHIVAKSSSPDEPTSPVRNAPSTLSESSSSFAADEPTHVAKIKDFAPPAPSLFATRPKPSADEPTHVVKHPPQAPPTLDFASERTAVSGRHDFISKALARPLTGPALGDRLERTAELVPLQDTFIPPMSAEEVSLALDETNEFLPFIPQEPTSLHLDPYKATLSPSSSLLPLYQHHPSPLPPRPPVPSPTDATSSLQAPVAFPHDPDPIHIPLRVEESEWEDVIRQETSANIDVTALQRQLFIASALGDPVVALEAEESRIMNAPVPSRGATRWPVSGDTPTMMRVVYGAWTALACGGGALLLGLIGIALFGATLSGVLPYLGPVLLILGGVGWWVGHTKTRVLEQKMTALGLFPPLSKEHVP